MDKPMTKEEFRFFEAVKTAKMKFNINSTEDSAKWYTLRDWVEVQQKRLDTYGKEE